MKKKKYFINKNQFIDKFTNKTIRYLTVESFDKLEKCTYKQIKVKMILTNTK